MFPISYFKSKGNNKQIYRDELKQGYIVTVVFGCGLIGQLARGSPENIADVYPCSEM